MSPPRPETAKEGHDLQYPDVGLHAMRCSLLALLLVGAVAATVPPALAQSQVDVHRTVYVTATEKNGDPAMILTAADLKVKENGRERQILDVQPSTEGLKIAIAVDELLAPYTVVRQAVWQFVQKLNRHADMAFYLMGRVNEKQVEYTSDLAAFWDTINALPPRARYPGNLVESMHEIAGGQRILEGRRVIVALAPEMAQLSSVTANAVLDDLRETGAAFYAVTIMARYDAQPTLEEAPTTRLEGGDLTQQLERDRVIGDGTKQSGGLRLSSMNADAFPAAMDRIADDLLHEYAVTYVIPAGTKSNGNVDIQAADGRDLTVRGPRLLPEL
jgi:hypothetical protein